MHLRMYLFKEVYQFISMFWPHMMVMSSETEFKYTKSLPGSWHLDKCSASGLIDIILFFEVKITVIASFHRCKTERNFCSISQKYKTSTYSWSSWNSESNDTHFNWVNLSIQKPNLERAYPKVKVIGRVVNRGLKLFFEIFCKNFEVKILNGK